jgi:hypothetical protein
MISELNPCSALGINCSWTAGCAYSSPNIITIYVIGLNSRVAHFNPEITAGCTLCNIVGPRPVAAETLEHLFFSCPTTQKMLHKLKEKYFYDFDIQREKFFWGIVSENERENICATILFDIFQYLIWQAKLGEKNPDCKSILL